MAVSKRPRWLLVTLGFIAAFTIFFFLKSWYENAVLMIAGRDTEGIVNSVESRRTDGRYLTYIIAIDQPYQTSLTISNRADAFSKSLAVGAHTPVVISPNMKFGGIGTRAEFTKEHIGEAAVAVIFLGCIVAFCFLEYRRRRPSADVRS